MPQSIRLTSGASHQHSTGRSWGRYFAFSSPVDLTGDGVTGSQAYVFSAVDYMCAEGRPELQSPFDDPVTCPTTPKPYLIRATSGSANAAISNPSVNATGRLVAFEAFGSLSPTCAAKPGAAGRKQVFIKNLGTGELKAVTCEPDGDSYQPSMNAGGAVTFLSTARLTGSTTGIPQVYVYQYEGTDPSKVAVLTGVTSGQFALGVAPSGAPMLNRNGTHVVFESRADLLNDGADTGVWDIYAFDRTNEILRRLTRGNGDSHNPYVEEKRPGSVFFDSVATNLKGIEEPFVGRQIYRTEFAVGDDSSLIEQWTWGPGNAWMPAVEPSGGKLLFLSDGDLLSNGTTGARLFSLDFRFAQPILYQITGRGHIGGRIGANLGSWFATFDSDDDVGGYGVCGRNIWAVTYDPTHYIEPGHARLPATFPGQVPGEPFPGNPHDGCADGNSCSTDTCVGGQICQHSSRPDGTSCGTGDLCSEGNAVCQLGRCQLSGALNCDDNNPCTQDVCDPSTGCAHTDLVCDDGDACTADTCDVVSGCQYGALEPMAGLACQSDQVRNAEPPSASRPILRKLARAQRLVAAAQNKKPRAQQRKLTLAKRVLQTVISEVGTDPAITPQQGSDLIRRIYALIYQIDQVLDELSARAGAGAQ